MSVPIIALPKGTGFVRAAKALAMGRGNFAEAARIAEPWRDSPAVAMALKNAVAQGTLGGSGWASVLGSYALYQDFVEAYRPQNVLARMSTRRVPFLTKVAREVSSGTVPTWVSESAMKPISMFQFDQELELPVYKLAIYIVVSMELIKMSTPAAEAVLRRILLDTVSSFIDSEFLSSNALVAGTSPAGICNGNFIVVGSSDPKVVLPYLASALTSWRAPCWITTPAVLTFLASQQYSSAAFLNFQGANCYILGLPTFATTNCPAGRIVLLDQDAILLADDSETGVELSAQSTIQMGTGTSPEAEQTVSLWQSNLCCLRVERYISWLVANTGCVVATDTTW